jgi:WD40 repeat protein
VAWNLKTGKRTKLFDGYGYATFSQDGKSLATLFMDFEGKKSAVHIHDAATLKETSTLDCPEKDRLFYLDQISPDGRTLAISLYAKKGAPREVWFRDAKTLEDRGRFIGAADPEWYGWGEGRFTPDGKYYVILDLSSKVVLWDVAAKKVSRTFEVETRGWHLAIAADGRTIAVAWHPKQDEELSSSRNADPRDYPQPRITLFDLSGDKPARTLITPHGFIGSLAFSPDGKLLAYGISGGVRLFDLAK